jgi:hypothetical protein
VTSYQKRNEKEENMDLGACRHLLHLRHLHNDLLHQQ